MWQKKQREGKKKQERKETNRRVQASGIPSELL